MKKSNFTIKLLQILKEIGSIKAGDIYPILLARHINVSILVGWYFMYLIYIYSYNVDANIMSVIILIPQNSIKRERSVISY